MGPEAKQVAGADLTLIEVVHRCGPCGQVFGRRTMGPPALTGAAFGGRAGSPSDARPAGGQGVRVPPLPSGPSWPDPTGATAGTAAGTHTHAHGTLTPSPRSSYRP